MKTADLYLRVGRPEVARGCSLNDQEKQLRNYCESCGIHVRKVVHDIGSAKTFNRPGWKKYITDLKRNPKQADFLLFVDWDRFSRDAVQSTKMVERLRKLGVEPKSVSWALANQGSTPDLNLLFSSLANIKPL